jgi:multidrug efflux system membrane fusion protein
MMGDKMNYLNSMAAILLLSLTLSCSENEVQAERLQHRTPVRTAVVQAARLAKPVHSSGMLSARREMRLSFNIPGIIAAVNADEGQTVAAGFVMAELNLSEIRARYKQAESGLEKAKRDVRRVRNLFADSVATMEQMQNAETGLVMAQAEYDVAGYHLRHARITAPGKGKILRRFADLNEMVGAGNPVFLFAGEEEAWTVRCGVSEQDLVRLHNGDSALVYFDAYPEQVFKGVVREVAGAMDPRSATFEVEISIPRGEARLASGFLARVDIRPADAREVLLIPSEALVEAEQDRGFVFLLNGDTVSKRLVRISHIDGNQIALTEGVVAGETVISDGAAYLSDGAGVLAVSE